MHPIKAYDGRNAVWIFFCRGINENCRSSHFGAPGHVLTAPRSSNFPARPSVNEPDCPYCPAPVSFFSPSLLDPEPHWFR